MSRKKAIKRINNLSNDQFEQARNIANLLRSIITEVEAFVNQIIIDNFEDELVDNLYLKIQLPQRGAMVNVELYNALTNTIVVFDMTLFEMLQLCMSNSLEIVMNEKIPNMVEKSQQYKKAENTNKVYLEHSLGV